MCFIDLYAMITGYHRINEGGQQITTGGTAAYLSMMRYCGLFHLEDIDETAEGGGPRCGSPDEIYHLRAPSSSAAPQSIFTGSPITLTGEKIDTRYYGIFYDEDVVDLYARIFVGSPSYHQDDIKRDLTGPFMVNVGHIFTVFTSNLHSAGLFQNYVRWFPSHSGTLMTGSPALYCSV